MANTCRYNGTTAPDINTVWVNKDRYPYAVLASSQYIHGLYLSTAPFVLSENTLDISEDGECWYFGWAAYHNSNEFVGDFPYAVEVGTPVVLDPGTVYWTSHDIYTTFDDSVFLAGSEPVPVESESSSGETEPIAPDTPTVDTPPRIEVDWSATMQQSFEYYKVDPGTWRDMKRLNLFKSSTITRDEEVETRGSATFDIVGDLEECYVRVYLVTIQNGVRTSTPLGTFLVQTPSTSFDGKITSTTVDAYTPLIELKEKKPPLGYSLFKDEKIMEKAYMIMRENVRAPVIKPTIDATKTLNNDFVSNVDDTWMSFCDDLVANAEHTIELDELGRVMYAPVQELESLQPIWTYTDDNSSILYPQITIDHDLYGIPNVVEVIYSNGKTQHRVRIVNDDPNSPVSILNRGREITYYDSNPSFPGTPTYSQVYLYAKKLLKQLSTVKYTLKYTHGYCPVRLGDCVRLNYKRSGITDVKAKVIRQTIKCEPGCPVEETAIFTNKLWGG